MAKAAQAANLAGQNRLAALAAALTLAVGRNDAVDVAVAVENRPFLSYLQRVVVVKVRRDWVSAEVCQRQGLPVAGFAHGKPLQTILLFIVRALV